MEKQSWKAKIVWATGGMTAIALAAGGVAVASTPSAPAASKAKSSTSASSSVSKSSRHTKGQAARWLATHTVHANMVVSTAKGYETINLNRGSLTTDSSNSITITRPDGPTVTASISSSTHFRGIKESKLAKGDTVVLVTGAKGNALVVWTRPPV